MPPKRLRWACGSLLALYAVSFILPLGRGVGFAAFLSALLFSYMIPGLLLYWVANPLFWFGLFSLRRGRSRSAAILGGLASLSAVLPMLPPGEGIVWNLPEASLPPVGYFVWLGSILGLAAIATAVWWMQSRPRLRIGTMM